MATREKMKMPAKDEPGEDIEVVPSQRRRPESGRYVLQVDRQSKNSYSTSEAAQKAGLAIKTAHPLVKVSVHDTVENAHLSVELPPT